MSRSGTTVNLKLDGKPFTLEAQSPALDRVLKFLDGQDSDQLFSSAELCTKALISRNTIEVLVKSPRTTDYRFLVPGANRRVFGNPKAIVALKKMLDERAE